MSVFFLNDIRKLNFVTLEVDHKRNHIFLKMCLVSYLALACPSYAWSRRKTSLTKECLITAETFSQLIIYLQSVEQLSGGEGEPSTDVIKTRTWCEANMKSKLKWVLRLPEPNAKCTVVLLAWRGNYCGAKIKKRLPFLMLSFICPGKPLKVQCQLRLMAWKTLLNFLWQFQLSGLKQERK